MPAAIKNPLQNAIRITYHLRLILNHLQTILKLSPNLNNSLQILQLQFRPLTLSQCSRSSDTIRDLSPIHLRILYCVECFFDIEVYFFDWYGSEVFLPESSPDGFVGAGVLECEVDAGFNGLVED
jgi:hypothetical protein